jgi:hypothetical protein
MSVAEAGVIDMWGIPDWDKSKIELVITDHLGWDAQEEMEHLLVLQEKINTYISFIESGEINEAIPAAVGKTPIIRVVGMYELSQQAVAFVDRVTEILRNADIEFEFVLRQG